jgi:RND family efflux transporter MFP subunit
MTRGKELTGALLVILLGALGTVALVRSSPTPATEDSVRPLPRVRTWVARAENLELKVASQGTVRPRAETTLVPEVAGKIVELSPQLAEGAFFSAGEVLLRVDPRDYELRLIQARADVAQTEARVAQEEGEAAIARAEWQTLGDGGPADPLVLREPQLRQARAALEASRAARDQAELALERTRIRAPYAGRVQVKIVDLGQWVGPGTPLAKVFAVDAAEVLLSVLPADLAYLDLEGLKAGSGAAATRPSLRLHARYAGRERTWEGEVVRLSAQIDPVSQMVQLIGRIEEPFGARHEIPLEMGLFVSAEIGGRHMEGVIPVPREALRGEQQVAVVDGEGRLHLRQVEVLKMEPTRVLVRGGLEAGDVVCLSRLESAVDGMRVIPVEDAS